MEPQQSWWLRSKHTRGWRAGLTAAQTRRAIEVRDAVGHPGTSPDGSPEHSS